MSRRVGSWGSARPSRPQISMPAAIAFGYSLSAAYARMRASHPGDSSRAPRAFATMRSAALSASSTRPSGISVAASAWSTARARS